MVFRGSLKIRTVVADLPQELVKALGASPTPIPWSELFTSFQTGVVEGSKNGITDIMGMDEETRMVIVDGFSALQQATFASPKRKSIQAYADFKKGGGNLYVPTPENKAAAAPVYDWFQKNVKDGEKWFSLLSSEAAKAEASVAAGYAMDIK